MISKVLNLKGVVLPFTDDNVILIGIEGEHNITHVNIPLIKLDNEIIRHYTVKLGLEIMNILIK